MMRLIDDFIENGDSSTSKTQNNFKTRKILGNLDQLLFIIKTVHNQQKKHTGYSKPFNFSKIINHLPYIDHDNNISGELLTDFIDQYLNLIRI